MSRTRDQAQGPVFPVNRWHEALGSLTLEAIEAVSRAVKKVRSSAGMGWVGSVSAVRRLLEPAMRQAIRRRHPSSAS